MTGMGGQLGSRVAAGLEARRDGDEVVGFDFLPPRRRLRRSRFRRLDASDRAEMAAFVRDVAPEVVVHLAVHEPHSRTSPSGAERRTRAVTSTVLRAAVEAGHLRRVVLRSGIEVYGRGRSRPTVPDELAPRAPGSRFGRLCVEVESVVGAAVGHLDVAVVALRFAPIVGAHVPSPLGRLLRLPLVPVSALADPPFCVLHPGDAARAVLAATTTGVSGPHNVVAPGAATPWQAVRLGNRVPVPVAGPAWLLARRASELAGAPVPDHVAELLRVGRAADGSRAVEGLGLRDLADAGSVLSGLFEWASITPLAADGEAVA